MLAENNPLPAHETYLDFCIRIGITNPYRLELARRCDSGDESIN
jgi:hypothetical protein